MSEGKRTAIVVGAGLGGISAAIGLAARGFAVQVFEANDKIGGKLNIMREEGFVFDLGPSIFILPEMYRRVFEVAGRDMDDYVRFQKVEPQWRSFFEDGVTVDLFGDPQAMRDELARIGGDPAEWDSFTDYSKALWEYCEAHYLQAEADGVGDILRSSGLGTALRESDLLSTMHQGVARHVSEPHLVHVLDFFIKYVGSSPYDAPALMNLLAWSQLRDGLFYVPGGMYGYAEGCLKLMGELGVQVHVNTPIAALRKDPSGKRVIGVTTAAGDDVDADVVVSNMEVIPTYEKLLGETGLRMSRYRWQYPPAASGLILHLGVDRTYEQLQHHNFFFSEDPKRFLHQIHRKHELPDDPTIYVVYPTRSDPDRAPEGHSIVKVLPHIPPLQDTVPTEAEYMALKERVLNKLERMGLEGLREHTVYEHLWLPADVERMYRSNKGAIYGVVADRKRNFALKAPRKSEIYERLWFVGGSVNPGGGTPMVVLCGQQVAEQVANEVR